MNHTLTVYCSEELVRGCDDSRAIWGMAVERLGEALDGLTPTQRRRLGKVQIVVVPSGRLKA